MEQAMKRNIKVLYVLRALRATLIAIPVIIPFFQANGLSQTEIFILQSVFAVTVTAFEVPSGYFADVFGRKRSILIGGILGALGFIVYSFSDGFGSLLLAEIILGFAVSFMSGADSALAYDSLQALDNKKAYRKYESHSFSYSAVAEAGASVIGGLLAIASIKYAIYAQVLVEFAVIAAALLLVEPPRVKPISANPFKDVLRVSKFALHGHSEIKWLILYGAVVGTLTHTMVWLTQPYYQLLDISIGWFGVLWAGQLLALAVFARFANEYETLLGRRRALASFVVIGVVAYIILGLAPSLFVLPAVLAFYFIRGVFTPVLRDYLNALIESDVRATVLSVQSLMQKLLYTALGPLIGVVFDLYSLQAALLFSAVVYGSLGLIALAALHIKKHL